MNKCNIKKCSSDICTQNINSNFKKSIKSLLYIGIFLILVITVQVLYILYGLIDFTTFTDFMQEDVYNYIILYYIK